MRITSPRDLQYPITIADLLAKRDRDVKRSDKLFSYRYETPVVEGDRWGGERTVVKKLLQFFNASADGKITRWFIGVGSVIDRAGINLLEIQEPCPHETQFGGLCADCGEDMTKIDYLTKESNENRATVNTTHDHVALRVSHKQAVAAEEDAKKRLLSAKKLTLIVDLDQTVIHTCCERTIAEWQADPDNPNHEAVRHVQSFQLADDNVSNVAASWYYVKMRPGLNDFFNRMSKIYEMHVYTMATRAYAQAVAKIIDPQRKYFGDRILSRDENYTDKLKSLTRLFYQNTDMVVIIDDRADVWSYSPHLVRVPVYSFFPGAGDINASFLPKQQEIVSFNKDRSSALKKVQTSDDDNASASASHAGKSVSTVPAETLDDLSDLGQQLVSLAAGDDLQEQIKEQEKIINAQKAERPLLQQQIMQDKEDEEAEENEAAMEIERGHHETETDHSKHRHAILNDDDTGLDVVERNLVQVHRTFYNEYVSAKTAHIRGRVAELKGEKSPKKRQLGNTIPDVAEIIPRIKEEVLNDVVVVFSGIIPLGVDVATSDFALWIRSFGAEVSTSVNRRTTHVIANPDRKTTKVKEATRLPHIKIVNPEWMIQCCTRWEHVDEAPYRIEIDVAERAGSLFEDPGDESVCATGDEDELAEPPITLNLTADNWADVDDELNDFLNETDTDGSNESDSDSIRSENSIPSDVREARSQKRKRARSTDVSEAEESDSSAASSSRLQRRKRRIWGRVTSLTNVVMAERPLGLPSPEVTGPEEGQREGKKESSPRGITGDLQDEDDDGLEAELLAGFGCSDKEQ